MRAVGVILATVAACGGVAVPAPPPRAHADLGAPPQDKRDAPPPRDGYVWMPGHWARSGDHWVWLEGYYERARRGYTWKPGHWVAAPAVAKAGPEDEWASSVRNLKAITQSDDLLGDNPTLGRSIRTRLPYLDPLNHLQVELIRRYRGGQLDMRTKRSIHLSINGLAAGLRNSG